MTRWIQRQDWTGLESRFQELANELAGVTQADRIAKIDFSKYQKSLSENLHRAIKLASNQEAKALYFEYDLDNDWQSTFFICDEYVPESEGNDDWACEWVEDLAGPKFPVLSEIYLENGFDRTEVAKGCTLYLIARTVATFGRCLDEYPAPATLAVCVAFHDQDPIFRLQERTY
ncbi:MAG: hypothetical protein JRI36_14220 [Deltaproteobacteria bacterium]|nr:hypothetical protein [Deltaproteobacteria bacterium]